MFYIKYIIFQIYEIINDYYFIFLAYIPFCDILDHEQMQNSLFLLEKLVLDYPLLSVNDLGFLIKNQVLDHNNQLLYQP